MIEESGQARDAVPARTPLEELLNTALLTAELAEAHLPHVVIAEVFPQREQIVIGPCAGGLEAMTASLPLEEELRREFPQQRVSIRVAPVHPVSGRPHGLSSVVHQSGPVSR